MNSKTAKILRKFVEAFNIRHAGSKYMDYEKVKHTFENRSKELQAEDLKFMKKDTLRLNPKN